MHKAYWGSHAGRLPWMFCGSFRDFGWDLSRGSLVLSATGVGVSRQNNRYYYSSST